MPEFDLDAALTVQEPNLDETHPSPCCGVDLLLSHGRFTTRTSADALAICDTCGERFVLFYSSHQSLGLSPHGLACDYSVDDLSAPITSPQLGTAYVMRKAFLAQCGACGQQVTFRNCGYQRL